ncbi:response regulator [Larkinella soli]|uniref:response regulator n=1 Tax=Larkinella soli TaxID=1770527 RepID=UPI0013E3AD13|nr:response regulator [Larkinella soli]
MTVPPLIFFVDDSADYLFLIRQVAGRSFPQIPIRFFTDGQDLIDEIESSVPAEGNRPRLIVLDIDMPRMDGFQTLRRLKMLPEWQSVPVVMMTNRVDSESEQESYRLGACSFLLKPMNLTAIRETLTQLCAFDVEANPFQKSGRPAA